uniref:Kizuna centrosomal protein n=2 Tax=Pan troglodytes TaxID=9598 RepID=A0A2I3RHR6_PANTR
MSRTLASAVPLSSPDYYERLGQLQHGLRDRFPWRLLHTFVPFVLDASGIFCFLDQRSILTKV